MFCFPHIPVTFRAFTFIPPRWLVPRSKFSLRCWFYITFVPVSVSAMSRVRLLLHLVLPPRLFLVAGLFPLPRLVLDAGFILLSFLCVFAEPRMRFYYCLRVLLLALVSCCLALMYSFASRLNCKGREQLRGNLVILG